MGTNDFSQETKHLFDYCYACFECGRNNIADPHHILGRGTKRDDCKSSPYNCAPLCRKCHDKGNINSKEKQCKYLNKTVYFLFKEHYELTEKDHRFIKKYKKYYE